MVKRIEVKLLLSWVYQDEMRKQDHFREAAEAILSPVGSPWDAIARLALLGCRVDTSGPAQDRDDALTPDPDAVLVSEAVLGFSNWTISMPDEWNALGDIEGLTDTERADAHRHGWDIAIPKGDRLAALVVRQAWSGLNPPWRDHGAIERRPVLGANGKPAWFRTINEAAPGEAARPREVDGYNRSRQRPHKGAYRRFYLDPCPSLLVAARIEYQAWALALHQLARDLQGKLARFDVHCAVPLWPWEGQDSGSSSRVLEVLPSANASQRSSKAA